MEYFITLFAAAFLFLSSTLHCESVEYYARPISTPHTECPVGKPCHTLDYYAQHSSILSEQESVSLLLIEGLHELFHNFKISDVELLVVAGFTEHHSLGSLENFTVECYYVCRIEFQRISSLKIQNLAMTVEADIILTPGSVIVLKVHKALLDWVLIDNINMDIAGELTDANYSVFKNSFITSTTLYYRQSEFPWSRFLFPQLDRELNGQDLKLRFFGCTIKSLFDKTVNIVDVLLSGDAEERVQFELRNTSYSAGGMQLCPYKNNSISLIITDSVLTGSKGIDVIKIFSGFRSKGNNITVQIRDSIIEGFRALSLEMDSTSTKRVNISIVNLTMSTTQQAMDFVMKYPDSDILSTTWTTHFDITIVKSMFINSTGVSVWVEVPFYVTLLFNMSIIGGGFYGNKWAIYVRRSHDKSLTQATASRSLFVFVLLKTVKFQNSYPSSPGPKSVVTVQNVNRMVIEDCMFIENSGTAVEAYFSDITFSGTTLFANNTGIKGGAIGLYQSYMLLSENSAISFIDNYAEDVGGAIYVQLLQESRVFQCFYLTDAKRGQESNTLATIDVWFQNNTAMNGGDDIYGGTLYSNCAFFVHSYAYLPGRQYIDDLFHFDDFNRSLSSVTSDPKRVCLCDDQGIPQCLDPDFIYKKITPRYPGESFFVSAVVVGNDFGTVPGLVYSEVSFSETNSLLVQNQRIQEIKRHQECTRLNFSLNSPLTNTVQTLKLTSNVNAVTKSKKWLQRDIESEYRLDKIISKPLLFHAVYIDVPLEDCPIGFNLTTTPPYICTCHPTLEDNGITVCIITNHTGWVYRSGTFWVSDSFVENETNSFVIHKYCPYDYCKQENISINLRIPDTQCLFNHSGVLCGGCQGNFSLVLGTSRCLQCNNKYVSLLLLFILAGIALVFFIKVLDLTVAKGTLYGLIFYANIVWVNKSIFFQTATSLHPAQHILQTFIAWLNLDFGIETCFIDGLDAYWKTWLQFVFPIYVWTIAGVIIIASHYSTRASRIFGNNSVPVLATLIFLSYTKLLSAIITTLGFALLNYPEGTRLVWSFDGNIPYFGAAHTILFLVALAALLLLWLPYTTVLLTLQWLRRKSYLKPLRWINRWKPFFDAYFGELKPKHHNWVGLLLLVRVILLVLSAAIQAIVPTLNIVAIIITGVILMVKQAYSGLIFKSLRLSTLENSFIINLVVLGVVTLYMDNLKMPNTPVIYTSVSIAFIEFLAIVIYHSWSRLRSTYTTYKRRHANRENVDNPADREIIRMAAAPNRHIHYREPLLDSATQN